MLHQMEKTVISLKPEEHQVIAEMARQEGQTIDTFIEYILRTIIERQRPNAYRKIPRIHQQFRRIRQHRETFLANHNNQPLTIDTVALLEQVRNEHDEHLFAVLTDSGR